MVLRSLFRRNWWDKHGIVHRIVLIKYVEYFCFLFYTYIAHIERCQFDKHLVHLSREKEVQMVKF